MRASLKNYRQSPRKVRLVGNLVKGKRVADAILELSHLPKRAGGPLKKLIESALANARAKGEDTPNLVVKDIRIDKGFVFKRMDPRARGSAYLIRKRTSNISVALEKATEMNHESRIKNQDKKDSHS
jgi:large subunit ribosomal protein L22